MAREVPCACWRSSRKPSAPAPWPTGDGRPVLSRMGRVARGMRPHEHLATPCPRDEKMPAMLGGRAFPTTEALPEPYRIPPLLPSPGLVSSPSLGDGDAEPEGRIAQLVEQLTLNQRVPGSSPGAPTKQIKHLPPYF